MLHWRKCLPTLGSRKVASISFCFLVVPISLIFLGSTSNNGANAVTTGSSGKPRPPPPSPPPQAQASDSLNNALATNSANSIPPLLKAALAVGSKQVGASKPQVQLASKSAERSIAANPPSAQDEPIKQLDYSTISDEVLRKRTANFVYFNANFNTCRHCGRFYITWKELALDIRWWRPVIQLFTINCSDEDNIEVCRKAGVTQFPQVKFYWIMSTSLDQDGQRLRILGKSVHAMRHLVMDRVLDSYTEHNKLWSQRLKQRASAASKNPLTAMMSQTPASAASSNPFMALMPLISQFLSPSGGTGTGAATKTSSPPNGLSSILGMLAGGTSGSKQDSDGGLSLMGIMNSFGGIQNVINALMSVASWRRSLTIQKLPNNWPELDAIEVADSQRLVNMLPLNVKQGVGALLIMETQEFLYTGLEVMLDLSTYSNQTYIARVRDDRSLLSRNLTKRDDIHAPALIYINETREPKLILTAPKYTNDEDLRRAFVRAYDRMLAKHAVKRVHTSVPSTTSASLAAQMARINNGSISSEDEEILNRANDVYMNDLLNTIRLSLTDQVFRHPDLSDDQYNALVKYIYALINYFPFKDEQRLKFMKRLHGWLQNQVLPLDLVEYKKQLHDVDEALGRREWLACKSLSSVNAVPNSARHSAGSLFENPSQFGKVVSNITRLFRTNQQKVGQLKNLLGMLTSRSSTPVMLSNLTTSAGGGRAMITTSTTTSTTTKRPGDGKRHESGDLTSTFEKLFKSVTNGSLGSDSSILKLISTALTGGDPSTGSAGKAKSKFAREFHCGAWKLAHVMVVNEYLLDSPRKDVRHLALQSLYQYMIHFYACTTCGNRVSDVSGEFRLNLNEHLVEQGDSIMLLWKMHNRVNKRLEAEIRPGSPAKQQFPNDQLCPKCRVAKQQGELQVVSTPAWSDKNVFGFLLHHYRPQNIIATIEPSDSSSSSSTSAANWLAPSFLSGDMSLFGLQLTSTLVLLWGHFRSRHRSIVLSVCVAR